MNALPPSGSRTGHSGSCPGGKAGSLSSPVRISRLVGSIIISCHARAASRSSCRLSSAKSVSKLDPTSCSVMLPSSGHAAASPATCVAPSPASPPRSSASISTMPSPLAAGASSSPTTVVSSARGSSCGRSITCTWYGSRSLSSPSDFQSSLSSRPDEIIRSELGCGGGASPPSAASRSSCHTLLRSSSTVWLECMRKLGRKPLAPPTSITCTVIGEPRTHAPCRRDSEPPGVSGARFSSSVTKRRSMVRHRSTQSCSGSRTSAAASASRAGCPAGGAASCRARRRLAASSRDDMHELTNSRCCCRTRDASICSEWWSSTRKRMARTPTASSRVRSAAAQSVCTPWSGTSSTEMLDWSCCAKRCSRQLIQRKRYSMQAYAVGERDSADSSEARRKRYRVASGSMAETELVRTCSTHRKMRSRSPTHEPHTTQRFHSTSSCACVSAICGPCTMQKLRNSTRCSSWSMCSALAASSAAALAVELPAARPPPLAAVAREAAAAASAADPSAVSASSRPVAARW